MKSSAITRIIIFSIVIVLLVGILLAGLGIGMFIIDFRKSTDTYTTVEDSKAQVTPGNIQNLEIEWAAGSIDIQTGDVECIIIEESGSFSEDQKMVMKHTGDTLTVYYSKPSFKIGFFSIINKDLMITVPKDWECSTLKVDVASADVSVQDWCAKEVKINTASGECDFQDCTIGKLDIDTASGSIHYKGVLNTLDCEAASGCFKGIFFNTPEKLQMDSASGELDITLPEDSGFRVNMDTASGKFNSEFPTLSDGDSYIHGDESCVIDFDAASGNIRIQKAT